MRCNKANVKNHEALGTPVHHTADDVMVWEEHCHF